MMQSVHVFDSWVDSCAGNAKKLNARSVLLYRQRWLAFVRYLAEQGKSVADAAPDDLQTFVNSRVLRAANGKQPSVLTTSRYLRNLQQVYRHGVLSGAFASNPADQVMLPFSVRPNGMVLPLPWLKAIVGDINMHPQSFTELRNAVLVQLCAVEAFSVADLTGLQLEDVQCVVPASAASTTFSASSLGSVLESGIQVQLYLRGRRLAQRRARLLEGTSALLVYKWIQLLPTLPGLHLSQCLFRSLPTKKSLTAKTVYEVCAEHVRASLAKLQVHQLPYHLGPNVLRNSRIVAWLNGGVSREAVCARIGIGGPSRLDRLAHAVNAY